MKLRRLPPWVNFATAAGCVAVAGGDAVLRDWWAVPAMVVAGGVNGLIGRSNRRREVRVAREAHRPDYAKIAALEIELGLVDPPKPKPEPKGGPFIAHAPEGRRSLYMPLPPPRPLNPSPQTREVLAREPVEIYPDAAPGTLNDYLNQVGRQVKWQRCPVCTRVHEGRCPG